MNAVVAPPTLQFMRTIGEIPCAKCQAPLQKDTIVIYDTDYQHIQCLDPMVLYHACPNGQFSQFVQGWKHLSPEDQRNTEEIFNKLLNQARYTIHQQQQHAYGISPQQQQLLLAQQQNLGHPFHSSHIPNPALHSAYSTHGQLPYPSASQVPSHPHKESMKDKEKEKSKKVSKDKMKKESSKSKSTSSHNSSKGSVSSKSSKKGTSSAGSSKGKSSRDNGTTSKPKKKKRRIPSSSESSSSSDDSSSTEGSRKRDPNAPKRPPTGYLYFCFDRRPSLKQRHPDAKPKELISMMGQAWRELSASEKKRYDERRQEDIKRYERELKEYKETGRYHDRTGALVELKSAAPDHHKKKKKKKVVKRRDSSDSDSDSEVELKRKPIKKKRKEVSSSSSDSDSDSSSSESEREIKKKRPTKAIAAKKKTGGGGGSSKAKSRG